ncbi:DUF2092 domain-containing protein [Pseudomonas schmalbachii]|nr:DUF2092 domain-containing protein [Pseudomonas schmalbachii]
MALAVVIAAAIPGASSADEADAKNLLKKMSDFLAAQKALSFSYDADLEVVTNDNQKLALANSGSVSLTRPDKIRATRHGGFANMEMVFDGKTATLLGKNANAYVQVETPGSVDHLVNELRDKYNRPVPAADLLLTDVYGELMADVTNVKDLGSGVIGGTECDYLAFRAKDVDWQIWIAQGEHPYPCRYVITSKQVAHSPQYSITFRDWKSGDGVAAQDYSFSAPANARKVDLKELAESDELPKNFVIGGKK